MSSKKGSARSKGSFFVCFLIMLSTRCRWWYDDEKRRMLELRCKCKLRYQIEFLQSLPDRNMYVSFWAVHTHHKKILHLFQWKYLHKMWWYYWNLCMLIDWLVNNYTLCYNWSYLFVDVPLYNLLPTSKVTHKTPRW